MRLHPRLRKALKAVAAIPSFNVPATTLLRALLRASGREAAFITRRLQRVGRIQVRLPHGQWLRLRSNADELSTSHVFWHGWTGHEPETMPLFYRLAMRSRVTFDIGANVGLFSLVAGHANPAGQVHAFEPFPRAYARLTENLGMNGLANVHCHRVAVGEVDGERELFYTTELTIPETSSLSRESVAMAAEYSSSVKGHLKSLKVPVITVDGFVERRQLPALDLLKIDTEGTEPAVLRGMLRAIERWRPLMICEVLRGFSTASELELILRPLGYQFYLLRPSGPERRDAIDAQPDDRWELRNYLFAALGPTAVAEL